VGAGEPEDLLASRRSARHGFYRTVGQLLRSQEEAPELRRTERRQVGHMHSLTAFSHEGHAARSAGEQRDPSSRGQSSIRWNKFGMFSGVPRGTPYRTIGLLHSRNRVSARTGYSKKRHSMSEDHRPGHRGKATQEGEIREKRR
jgi:hypothetical protein